MATAKPPPTSPSTCSGPARTPSKSRRPIGCGATSSRCSPVRPSLSRGIANAVMPFGALVRGAREDGVDVRLRRVRDPELRAGEAEAVAVLFRPELQRGRVGARFGLAERERRDGVAGGEPGDPVVAQLRLCGPQDRVSAEALERERRLRLGAAVRQPLAQLAELLGRTVEDELQEPFVAQRLDERPVQPAGLALAPRSPRTRSWPSRRARSRRSAIRQRRDAHQLDLRVRLHERRDADRAPSPGSACRSGGARPRRAPTSRRGTRRSRSCRRRARRDRRARRRRRAWRVTIRPAAESNCSTSVSPSPIWPPR